MTLISLLGIFFIVIGILGFLFIMLFLFFLLMAVLLDLIRSRERYYDSGEAIGRAWRKKAWKK